MTYPRASHLREIPAVRHEAPVRFREALHKLALELSAVPATGNEPVYCSIARGLVHCAKMEGHARGRLIIRLERQLVTELFGALPPNEPARLLRAKA